LRPRRSRCRVCRATHVLTPTSTLARRRDAIEVIGAALIAKLAGHGYRRTAAQLGMPASTVRGWRRRFASRAEQLGRDATVALYQLDGGHPPVRSRGSPFADALETLGLAAAAAIRRFGPARSSWHAVAALTGALMLAPQPSRPL
ncbi:MAG: helix-turn-helix domain-containing protein, partial [Acidimicrobiales bacterium]